MNPLLVDAAAVKAVGAVVMTAGLIVYALALHAFGASWRLGIDRDTPGKLMTGGVFARTRNPIYVGLGLLFLGTFLLQGRLAFLVLALLMIALLHDLILREERFLTETYGDAYREYCTHVRRYWTW
jgi:protein-S-isoprenylcysteine O-methyltransferase Ste14